MKSSTFTKLIICACITVTALSCKKTTTTTTPPPASTAFTFKVDSGSVITVDSATAMLYNLPGGIRYMDVYAFKAGAEVLEFHFVPKTGSNAVGGGLGGTSMTYMETPVSSFDAQTGTLNITTCDTVGNKIVGDFNFVGKVYPYTGSASHTISEGHMVVTKLQR